jgi:hypothetical protein
MLYTIKTIMLLCLLAAGTAASAQNERWYEIVSSDNRMWKPNHNISITPIGGDSVWLSGYSNQGADVLARLRGDSIYIHRQVRTITPFGGFGKVKPWDIVAEAKGILTDSSIVLHFYFAQDTFSTRGLVRGVRIK